MDVTHDDDRPPFDPIAFSAALGKLGDALADMDDRYVMDGHDAAVSADLRIRTRRSALKAADDEIGTVMDDVRSNYLMLYADEERRKDALIDLAESMLRVIDVMRTDD